MFTNGAVTSAHSIATETGLSMLKQGANAVDAAVTTALALSVVEPQNSGLGGYGGFATIYNSKENKVFVLDFNTRAPLKSTSDMFVDSSNMSGGKAVAIPGILKGLCALVKDFGSLSINDCLEPSINLAKNGFPVNEALHQAFQEPHLNEETRKSFRMGKLKTGDILKRLDYAQTLKTIRDKGEDSFYSGEIAQRIINTIISEKGILGIEDLSEYNIRKVEPGRINYHNCEIFFPLMGAGGTTMAQILKILENFNLQGLTELELVKLTYKVMQYAFYDRFAVLENPNCKENDALELINKNHCEKIAEKIKNGYSCTQEKAPSLDANHTTHLCTVDKDKNMVSLTLTNGPLWFGSGITVKETGIVLNNGMALFNTDPNHLNAPSPKRTPLTNMCPTIVTKEMEPFLAIGTPGARRIITIVALTIMQIVSRDLSLKKALDQPRIHAEDNVLWMEDFIDKKILDELDENITIEVLQKGHFYGSTTAIQITENNFDPQVDFRFPGSGEAF
jgi:gamma-glutamyltranspeptidase/glutathione hydrolase